VEKLSEGSLVADILIYMFINFLESLNPKYFDILGLFTFVYVIYVSSKLINGEKVSKTLLYILMALAIGGFVVDLLFVSTLYLEHNFLL